MLTKATTANASPIRLIGFLMSFRESDGFGPRGFTACVSSLILKSLLRLTPVQNCTQCCRSYHSQVCAATKNPRVRHSSHNRRGPQSSNARLTCDCRQSRRRFLFRYLGRLSFFFRPLALLEGDQIQRMLVLVVLDRHLAVKPGPVHGIGIGIEDDSVEVPDDDGESRQHRFVPVNRDGNVDPPARHAVADAAS